MLTVCSVRLPSNVDVILQSSLASLADLGYTVEWRVINAAEYGMPQRRRRTYIVGYRENSNVSRQVQELKDWVLYEGVLAKAFPFKPKDKTSLNLRLKELLRRFRIISTKKEKTVHLEMPVSCATVVYIR